MGALLLSFVVYALLRIGDGNGNVNVFMRRMSGYLDVLHSTSFMLGKHLELDNGWRTKADALELMGGLLSMGSMCLHALLACE